MKKAAMLVYESLAGTVSEEYRVQGVENLFAANSECDRLYAEIYNANCKLCRRLRVAEDPDVETIINNFWEISRLLGIKMYEYGQKLR